MARIVRPGIHAGMDVLTHPERKYHQWIYVVRRPWGPYTADDIQFLGGAPASAIEPVADGRGESEPPTYTVYTFDTWLEARLGDEWIAAYRLVPQRGVPVIAEFRLFPAAERDARSPQAEVDPLAPAFDPFAPPGGISARLLRAVPIWAHRALMPQLIKTWRDLGVKEAEVWAGVPVAPLRRSGRRGRDDRFYADVAAVYVTAFEAGSRRPTVEVARRFEVPTTNARDLVHEARTRGLLTGGGRRGQPGGQLTPKARTLLGLASATGERPSGARRSPGRRRRPTKGK